MVVSTLRDRLFAIIARVSVPFTLTHLNVSPMKTDFLHRMLRSMEHGELQACRASTFMSDGKWSSQRKTVFKTLLGQEDFDAKALEAAIADAEYLKMLPLEKHRMQTALLETLMAYRKERDSHKDPWQYLEKARLLLELGMLEETEDLCQQGLSKAMAVEDVFAELQIREQLRIIYKGMPRKEVVKKATDNAYRLAALGEKVADMVRYNVIADELADLHSRYRITSNMDVFRAMDTLVADPLMSHLSKASSLPAQIRFATGWAFYYRSKGDLEKVHEYMTLSVRLWETNTNRIAYLPQLYRQAMCNLIANKITLAKYDEVPALLQRMEQVPINGRRAEIEAFCEVELQYQFFFMNTGQLQKGLEREDHIVQRISSYGHRMHESSKLSLLYNLGIYHLLAGNDRKALSYFSKIYDLGLLHSRTDLQGLSRILRLLLLLENDTAAQFHNYFRRSKQFFKEQHPAHHMEELVYAWIQKHYRTYHPTASADALMQLYEDLEPYEKQHILGAEELRLWAYGRAKGIPLVELFLQKIMPVVG